MKVSSEMKSKEMKWKEMKSDSSEKSYIKMKTDTFAVMASNFVREQLKIQLMSTTSCFYYIWSKQVTITLSIKKNQFSNSLVQNWKT